MDYQRAYGVTGRSMPVRPWVNPSWNKGGHTCEPAVTPAHEREVSEQECCEHLAIVSSPMQCWQNLYTPCEALSNGTLFKDLNLPLVGCAMGACNQRRVGGVQ